MAEDEEMLEIIQRRMGENDDPENRISKANRKRMLSDGTPRRASKDMEDPALGEAQMEYNRQAYEHDGYGSRSGPPKPVARGGRYQDSSSTNTMEGDQMREFKGGKLGKGWRNKK